MLIKVLWEMVTRKRLVMKDSVFPLMASCFWRQNDMQQDCKIIIVFVLEKKKHR